MPGQAPVYDVICLGSCCWDVLGICEEYPELDQKRPLVELTEQGGGQAATAAACIARLGGRVAFVGRVGDDEYGRKIVAAFKQAGVDVSWGLQTIPSARSQFAFCVAEQGTGRRAIFWQPPSTGQLSPDELDLARFESTRVVLVDGHHVAAAIAVARWCQQRQIPVVGDLERPRDGIEDLLALCTYPVLPEEFAIFLADADDARQAAQVLSQRIGRPVVVTLGEHGSVVWTEQGIHHQPAFEIPQVVDTTGAGDVYHGALAFALSQGKELLSAMRFASAAAALSCRALGGRAGLPTYGEVVALMDRGEKAPA